MDHVPLFSPFFFFFPVCVFQHVFYAVLSFINCYYCCYYYGFAVVVHYPRVCVFFLILFDIFSSPCFFVWCFVFPCSVGSEVRNVGCCGPGCRLHRILSSTVVLYSYILFCLFLCSLFPPMQHILFLLFLLFYVWLVCFPFYIYFSRTHTHTHTRTRASTHARMHTTACACRVGVFLLIYFVYSIAMLLSYYIFRRACPLFLCFLVFILCSSFTIRCWCCGSVYLALPSR
ncbi:hypothetical protein ABB37_09019 [Leptomonas pyrrhocoris]|uniref:Uncharacterized protein n=1 Tax=Leptomonas pyrrhocoris TaxID=157538 RepID=A0A0N1J4A7_LEPPY|nr:hypothetical protein ABB37_09019 [Leptomonas pyrrhocoris]KPA74701.1 hypothetical protein ABB37_09019 [Leptomonas pyrrhocoris]|eukprot:XP_015653140.1 hypothetical protein ABB37_09019 [Leptomonas pyrrhocoris]